MAIRMKGEPEDCKIVHLSQAVLDTWLLDAKEKWFGIGFVSGGILLMLLGWYLQA